MRLDEAGVGKYALLPIHDEVVFDIPLDEMEEATVMITQAMTDDRWKVPITVGVDGPMTRWGDKYA